jgi:hypothetical protein
LGRCRSIAGGGKRTRANRPREATPGMPKKTYLLAIACYAAIPVVAVSGALLTNAINPEIAAGHPDYVRNYQHLELVKRLSFLTSLATMAGLWLLTCFFLIRSKLRSLGWLPLAALGPFGLIGLTLLDDRQPAPGDRYQGFLRRRNVYQRVALEVLLFVIAWVAAGEAVDWKHDLMVQLEAARTGVSPERILEIQSASGGMWAFGEGMEVMALVVLIYLLWPLCFNAVGHLLSTGNSESS